MRTFLASWSTELQPLSGLHTPSQYGRPDTKQSRCRCHKLSTFSQDFFCSFLSADTVSCCNDSSTAMVRLFGLCLALAAFLVTDLESSLLDSSASCHGHFELREARLFARSSSSSYFSSCQYDFRKQNDCARIVVVQEILHSCISSLVQYVLPPEQLLFAVLSLAVWQLSLPSPQLSRAFVPLSLCVRKTMAPPSKRWFSLHEVFLPSSKAPSLLTFHSSCSFRISSTQRR